MDYTPRSVALGRLPAAVFSTPLAVTTAGGQKVVYVGCRDDFVHCLRIT